MIRMVLQKSVSVNAASLFIPTQAGVEGLRGGVSDRPAPGPGAQAPHRRGIAPSFFPRNVRVHLPNEMHATKPLGFTTQYSFSCTIFSCPPVLRLRPLGGACGQPPPPRGPPRCWSLTVAPFSFSFALSPYFSAFPFASAPFLSKCLAFFKF